MKITIETRATFLQRLQGHFAADDIALIMFAYDLSKEAHRPQNRRSGERYFEHPRATCIIMMDELGLYDRDAIIEMLLHDTGEDTPLFGNVTKSYDEFVATAGFRIGKIFGERIAAVTIRLTKPSVDNIRFHTKEEAYDHYIAGVAADEDAIFGKMLDRLHNLRSLPANNVGAIKKQIKETETVYMPIFTSIQGPKKPYAERLLTLIQDQLTTLKANL